MFRTTDRLLEMIEARGWRGRICSIDHLADLQNTIHGTVERGLLSESFYRERLSWFSFDLPDALPGARSIIAVAVPTPQMRITFRWQGERVPVIVPPTYASYTPRAEHVQSLLAHWLAKEGYRLAKPKLPLKTLAVHSGLARYGRNNICFVHGMGSFLQLVGAISDLPCEDDSWGPPEALDLCRTCVACRHRCPTGAIGPDRFLLRAERCLTYHNEAEGNFADWIDPDWHHCLVGCMRCQTVCPENKDVKEWCEVGCEFSEREAALLLDRVPVEQLPSGTNAKLNSLEIDEEYRLLCRNLLAVISRVKRTS